MRFIYTRAFAVFAGLLVAVTVFVFLQTKGLVDPIRTVILGAPRPVIAGVRAVVDPIQNFFSVLTTLKTIVTENARLTSRLRELEQSQIHFDQLNKENELLRNELGFIKTASLKLIPCNVLSFDPEGISDRFVIRCGKSDGVKEGAAVISRQHLAGKVIFAGSSTSTAEFLTHPESSVDTKVSRSGSLGVLKGSYASGLTFEALSQGIDIKEGDLIVTGGVNSKIPGGILVGEALKVISKDNELFKRSTVISPLNFRTLQYVFVVN